MKDDFKNTAEAASRRAALGKTLVENLRNHDIDVELLRNLIAKKADVHQVVLGKDALLSACWWDHTKIVPDLIKAGANVNVEDGNRMTPLMHAVDNHNIKILNMLLKAGAGADHRDDLGMSALMAAANDGHADMIEILVKAGGRVNARDIWGSTPLTFAAQHGHLHAVEALLKHGARTRTKGRSNDAVEGTALEIAAAKGHTECAALIHQQDALQAKNFSLRCQMRKAAAVRRVLQSSEQKTLRDIPQFKKRG